MMNALFLRLPSTGKPSLKNIKISKEFIVTTIADKLCAIKDCKTDIASAIEARGIPVEGSSFSDYATLIGQIASSSGCDGIFQCTIASPDPIDLANDLPFPLVLDGRDLSSGDTVLLMGQASGENGLYKYTATETGSHLQRLDADIQTQNLVFITSGTFIRHVFSNAFDSDVYVDVSSGTAQVNADWEATAGAARILNKPDLAQFARTDELDTSVMEMNDALEERFPFYRVDLMATSRLTPNEMNQTVDGVLLSSLEQPFRILAPFPFASHYTDAGEYVGDEGIYTVENDVWTRLVPTSNAFVQVEKGETAENGMDTLRLVYQDANGLQQWPANSMNFAPILGYLDLKKFVEDSLKEVRTFFSDHVDLANPPATNDGLILETNDRVLLGGQTNPAENGIYRITANSWQRIVQSKACLINISDGTLSGKLYLFADSRVADLAKPAISVSDIPVSTDTGNELVKTENGLYARTPVSARSGNTLSYSADGLYAAQGDFVPLNGNGFLNNFSYGNTSATASTILTGKNMPNIWDVSMTEAIAESTIDIQFTPEFFGIKENIRLIKNFTSSDISLTVKSDDGQVSWLCKPVTSLPPGEFVILSIAMYGGMMDKIHGSHNLATVDIVGGYGYRMSADVSADAITTALGYTPYDGEANPKAFATQSCVDEAVSKAVLTFNASDAISIPVNRDAVITINGACDRLSLDVIDDPYEKDIFFTSGSLGTELNLAGTYRAVGELTVEPDKAYLLCMCNKVVILGECSPLQGSDSQ